MRGAESARLIAPENRPLHMLGLGMSVGTPPGGITGDVVVVSDFDELAQLGRSGVRGKIVLFNAAYRRLWPDRRVSHRRTVASGGVGRGGRAGALHHAAGDADSAYRLADL